MIEEDDLIYGVFMLFIASMSLIINVFLGCVIILIIEVLMVAMAIDNNYPRTKINDKGLIELLELKDKLVEIQNNIRTRKRKLI